MSITSTQLQQQYIAYFGRPGDPEGINYWTSDATDITTAAEFAEKIYAQSEYQTTTIASKTTSEQVNQLYVNLFARSADAEGLLYWTTEIEKGTLSLSNLAFDLITAAGNPIAGNEGQAAQDAATLNAKTAAAEAYTQAVAGNASALMAYQPGAAYESAVSFISSVSFNAQVNQAVITTGASLAPLSAGNVNAFVSQMLGSQATADAATAQADAVTAQADALAAAQASQLQAAQLQAAQAEAAAAQATLANQQAITAAAAEEAAAAEAAAAAPQTFILKTTLDNLSGGSDNDLFNGAAGTIDSDILSGGAGDDTLKVTLSNAGDDGAAFQSTDIENFKFRTTGAVGLDLGDVTGLTSITAERNAGNLTLSDLLEIPTTVTIDRASDGATPANLTIEFNGTTIEGTGDEITLNVSKSSNSGATTINGIETINVVSTDDPAGTTKNDLDLRATGSGSATEVVNISGTGDLDIVAADALTVNNSASGDVDLVPTAATTITHTGSGKLTVATAAVASTTTASGTGALTFTAGAAVQSVTGSSGDDRFDFQATLAATDTVAGGEGTDTLVLLGEATGYAATTKVSGIETVEIDTENNDNAIDFDDFGATQAAAISTVNVDITGGAANTNAHQVTLTNVQASTYGVSTMSTGDDGDTLALLTIDLEDASGDTAITINLNNKQTTAAGNDMVITTLQAAGVETLTINADAVASTSSAADNIEIATLTTTSLKTLNINGDADFLYDNAAGLEDGITTINASGASDVVNLQLSPTSGAITYTGGSGVDTLNFGETLTSDDSVDGGAGSDTVTATFASGTVTPAAMTSVENFDATFSGGALNASNFGDLTTIEIADINASAVISGIPATVTTINQLRTSTTSGLNLQYAAGSDATVTLTNIGGTADDTFNIANASTTVNNVKNLTVDASDNATTTDFNKTWDLGSLNAGAALTDLTLITNLDADDDLTVGNISAVNLENLSIQGDEGFINVGTIASVGELKTFSITNKDADSSGLITVGAVGGTVKADELTSFSIVTSGDADETTGTEVHMVAFDADSATAQTLETFTIDLNGNYVTSTLGKFDADDVAAIDISIGNDGTSFILDGFDLTGSITGDVNFTNGGSTGIDNGTTSPFIDTEASGSVGNISFTNTAEGAITLGQGTSTDVFLDTATTVGNITIDTGTNTDGTAMVLIGSIPDATTVGNITFSGKSGGGLDGFPAATSIGNISGSVDAGQGFYVGDAVSPISTNSVTAGVIGTTGGVMGNTTVTGGGEFGMAVGPVTTLGNIDLTGMNAATSGSDIRLSATTSVGVVYQGSTGSDSFIGTGGSDVITPGLGGDTVTPQGGADAVDLTEVVESTDTVIVTGDAIGNTAIDIITGFGVTTDRIAFDISAITALKAGEVVNLVEDTGLTETVAGVTPLGLESAVGADLDHGTGQTLQAGNVWFIEDDDIAAIPAADVVSTLLSADDTVGPVTGDVVPTLYYDNAEKHVVVGLTEHLQANTGDSFIWNVATFSPSMHIPMTFAQYEDIYTGSQEATQIVFV